MYKKILLLAGLAVIMSCNNSDKDKDASGTDSPAAAEPAPLLTPAEKAAALAGCYSVVHNRDTSSLQLEVNGTNVTGPLTYILYEKDKNDGTIQAEVSGDLLTGWYFFKSEGIMSVRQVIWKIHKNELWPGMGEMRSSKDTLLFKDPSSLQYDSTHPFVKVPCML